MLRPEHLSQLVDHVGVGPLDTVVFQRLQVSQLTLQSGDVLHLDAHARGTERLPRAHVHVLVVQPVVSLPRRLVDDRELRQRGASDLELDLEHRPHLGELLTPLFRELRILQSFQDLLQLSRSVVLVQARDLDSTIHAELLELNRGVEVELLPDVLNEDRLGDLAVCPASLEHPLDGFSVYAPARLVHLRSDLLEPALSIPELLDAEVSQDLETVIHDLSTADSIDVAVVSEERPVLRVLLDVLDRRLFVPLVGNAELHDERLACFQLRGVRQLSRSYLELTTCS